MSIKPAAGEKPAGEAAPAPQSGLVSTAKRDLEKVGAEAERFVQAIEAWYAKHYHRCAQSGAQPITAEDKASLIQHVTEAAHSKPQE